MTKLYDLTVERAKHPLALPTSGLRFGWKLDSDGKNVKQTAYRLTVKQDGRTVYDKKTASSQTVDVTPKISFAPGKEYEYTVTSYTTDGECSASDFFAVSHKMHGKFIRPSKHIEGACVYFRREFKCAKTVKRAVAYVAGLGWGNLYVNGERVDRVFFDAPFTNYEKTVLYRAYDITSLLSKKNCVGVHCGEGFYAQSRVWGNKAFKYGDICCYAQINIEYKDGTEEEIVTKPREWQTMYSPTVLANVHGGEIHDARRETPDWCKYGFDHEDLRPAVADTVPKGRLKGAIMPPCRVIRNIKPVAVNHLHGEDSGIWVYDMGQNYAGTVTLRPPKSAEGSTYILRFAETVDENGQIDDRSIGVYHVYCEQQQIYIASGKDNEEWTPEFSYHGFRYVEVTGWYGRDAQPGLIEGLAISTDFETRGKVETSDKDLNDLQTVMMRTIRSNYHGMPEDCPAREKCGWLGDAQIVCDTAIYNYDMAAPYEKYLNDVRESRDVYGDWTMIAPGKRTCGWGSPLWGCAQIVIPYKLYTLCGDKKVLKDNFAYMCDWIEHELKRSKDLLIDEGLGDWCPPVGNADARRIPVIHSSTFMFFEETKMLADICRALGRDGKKYDLLAEDIRESINRNFYDKKNHTYGYYASNAAAWLLHACPDEDRDALVKSTVKLIEDCGYIMTTGIYGNKYLIPMLFETGHGDVAMKVMFGRTFHDFGTMLDDGATSLWECLEMENVGMKNRFVASYNHPMHSGFAYMYYAELAGIKPVKPGFAEFEISPCQNGAPEKVYAEYDSANGLIVSDRDGDTLKIRVPANTVCRVKFGQNDLTVGSGIYTFTK
ncbi:MAG: family 78 glycoside hydrolase catalytic domain [Clostridia bacterium]|nr:family 78 glycoside hydrolase catalytic domain [Clostridia bacterium]